jgi:hypothetical protein
MSRQQHHSHSLQRPRSLLSLSLSRSLWLTFLCYNLLACLFPSSQHSSTVWAEEFVPPSTPDYTQLEKFDSSQLSKRSEFRGVVEQMAGYYTDEKRAPELKKTILMAGINYSYRDFYHNFKCFADRLGIKFLPVALDQQIYRYLHDVVKTPTFLMPDIPGRDKVPTSASGFGGKPFNLIGCRKLEAVAGALTLGYNVIFSDVDIAVLSDPIDHLFFPGKQSNKQAINNSILYICLCMMVSYYLYILCRRLTQ